MWKRMHSITVSDIEPSQIWGIWSDINNRHLWDLDIEWARLEGPFATGSKIRFKPKGGPRLSMAIVQCEENKGFTDCYKIPFARLYGIHQMEKVSEGLCIKTTIIVEGLLGWLLRKIVAEKVAEELQEQTDMLIKLARAS